MFFDREYVFKGKHAKYVNELKTAIFRRNVDVLLAAPILGLIFNRKSSIDNEFNSETDNKNLTTKIFADVMINEQEKVMFNYRLCMLLSDEFNDEEKLDNAFKYYVYDDKDIEKQKTFNRNIKLYNSYILGGVEILYELMLKENKDYNGNPDNEQYKSSVISNVTEFISDYLEKVKIMDDIEDDLI